MDALNIYCLLKIKENEWREALFDDIKAELIYQNANLKMFQSMRELKKASARLEQDGAAVYPVEWGPAPTGIFFSRLEYPPLNG